MEPNYTIYARWVTGMVEEVDEAETKEEARYLVHEYRFAYGEHAREVWLEKKCDSTFAEAT